MTERNTQHCFQVGAEHEVKLLHLKSNFFPGKNSTLQQQQGYVQTRKHLMAIACPADLGQNGA